MAITIPTVRACPRVTETWALRFRLNLILFFLSVWLFFSSHWIFTLNKNGVLKQVGVQCVTEVWYSDFVSLHSSLRHCIRLCLSPVVHAPNLVIALVWSGAYKPFAWSISVQSIQQSCLKNSALLLSEVCCFLSDNLQVPTMTATTLPGLHPRPLGCLWVYRWHLFPGPHYPRSSNNLYFYLYFFLKKST